MGSAAIVVNNYTKSDPIQFIMIHGGDGPFPPIPTSLIKRYEGEVITNYLKKLRAAGDTTTQVHLSIDYPLGNYASETVSFLIILTSGDIDDLLKISELKYFV